MGRRGWPAVVAGALCVGALAAPGGAGAASPRAFELVTPADSLGQAEANGSFAVDADTVIFNSYDPIAGATPNGPFPGEDSYRARRGATGWTTDWATDGGTVNTGVQGSRTLFASPGGERQVFVTEGGLDPADVETDTIDPYLRVAGANTWLTPVPRPVGGTVPRNAIAATPDLQTVLITTDDPLLPADADAATDLYRWTAGGLELVTSGTSGAASAPASGGLYALPGTLSQDGSRVFFVTSDALVAADTDTRSDLYVRDGGTTRLVSVDRRTVPATAANLTATVGISSDGDRACFTTTQSLEDADTDARADVYCYRLSTDTLERVSAGLNDNDTNAATGLGVSADGSSVFFSTATALTADDTDGVLSLYRRSAGVTQYVSRLAAADAGSAGSVNYSQPYQRGLRIAADGSWAVFATSAAADPADTDGQRDVYRWSQATGLQRISATSTAGNDAVPATIGDYDPSSGDLWTNNGLGGRVASGDGADVFFETTEALDPADTDGGRLDVYEWSADDGVRLVSPAGSAPYDAHYLDNSADGGTVFFVTGESILPQDVNGDVADLYAARVGGGFAVSGGSTLGAEPGASGPGLVPTPAAPASTGAPSGGNVVEQPQAIAPSSQPAGAKTARVTTGAHALRAAGGAVDVGLRVSGPGRLVATLGGRPALGSAHHTFRSAGRATVRLKLTAKARRQLARRGAVRVRLTLRFTPTAGRSVSTSRTVVVRSAAGPREAVR